MFAGMRGWLGWTGRVQVDFAGRNTGNRRLSVSGMSFVDFSLPPIGGAGYGYAASTDPRRRGSFPDVRLGAFIVIPNHPVYRQTLYGFFAPGYGGVLVGRDVIGIGGLPFGTLTLGPAASAGGYAFVQHPALGWMTDHVYRPAWQRFAATGLARGAWSASAPIRASFHFVIDPVRSVFRRSMTAAGATIARLLGW